MTRILLLPEVIGEGESLKERRKSTQAQQGKPATFQKDATVDVHDIGSFLRSTCSADLPALWAGLRLFVDRRRKAADPEKQVCATSTSVTAAETRATQQQSGDFRRAHRTVLLDRHSHLLRAPPSASSVSPASVCSSRPAESLQPGAEQVLRSLSGAATNDSRLTRVPESRLPARANPKFSRLTNAPVLTQASATSEYPVGGWQRYKGSPI